MNKADYCVVRGFGQGGEGRKICMNRAEGRRGCLERAECR